MEKRSYCPGKPRLHVYTNVHEIGLVYDGGLGYFRQISRLDQDRGAK